MDVSLLHVEARCPRASARTVGPRPIRVVLADMALSAASRAVGHTVERLGYPLHGNLRSLCVALSDAVEDALHRCSVHPVIFLARTLRAAGGVQAPSALDADAAVAAIPQVFVRHGNLRSSATRNKLVENGTSRDSAIRARQSARCLGVPEQSMQRTASRVQHPRGTVQLPE